MIRFLLFLLNKTGYESCKSCETLKEQLRISSEEKAELTATLLGLLKPKVYEAAPTELSPVIPKVGTWNRRRQALEEAARNKAQIIAGSPFVGKVDERVESDIKSLDEEIRGLQGAGNEKG